MDRCTSFRTQQDLGEVPLHINRPVYDRRIRIKLIALKHTRRGQSPRRTFGTNVHLVLLCSPADGALLWQTFVPNARPGLHARQDAYLLWMCPLDITEGLRTTVNMQ